MLGEEKSEIRMTLYKFLLTHHLRVPNFIRNKLGKLVVDIGRNDWPHFYPDFFANIIQLIQNGETTSLGLMLLQTASEELAFPRENLSNSRKEELQKLLTEQVPAVLAIIASELYFILRPFFIYFSFYEHFLVYFSYMLVPMNNFVYFSNRLVSMNNFGPF